MRFGGLGVRGHPTSESRGKTEKRTLEQGPYFFLDEEPRFVPSDGEARRCFIPWSAVQGHSGMGKLPSNPESEGFFGGGRGQGLEVVPDAVRSAILG